MRKVEVTRFPVTDGTYVVGSRYSPVAVLVIGTSEKISEKEQEICLRAIDYGAAIAGICKTANLGIEKVIINTICNPNIRWLIIAGRENAHGVGITLLSFFKYGIDPTTRRINVPEKYKEKAKEAYIPNLPLEAVERFRRQITPIPAIVLEDERLNIEPLLTGIVQLKDVTIGTRSFTLPILPIGSDYLKVPVIEKYLENIVLFLVHACLQEPENKVKVELIHEYSDISPASLELYDPGAFPEKPMIIEQASPQIEVKVMSSMPVVAGASPYGVLQVSRTVYAWFNHAGEAYGIIKPLILRYGVKRPTRHGDTREIALVITYRYMPWFKFEEENGKIRIVDFDTQPLESCSYPLKNREYIREYCEELLNGVWREPGKQHYSYGAQMRRFGYELSVFADKLVDKYFRSGFMIRRVLEIPTPVEEN
ncbi:MAG: hypothetical protein GXO26_03515, partial [Crenarchaeota archaeon]|nr:hypothetical protein [Thermoproteota archaeon]